jgi:lipid II:glycine glycyltransferase (peptidoglycan interpeptide bridge formation enzyme)
MEIKKINKFADIPDSDLLSDKIPIFATQNYADYLKDLKNIETIWFSGIENNKLSFLLPFVISKRLVFKKGYCLTGVISLFPEYSLEKEKDFLENVVTYLRKNKLCDWIQQGPNWALFKTFPKGSKAVKYGTYKIFLKSKNEDELFGSVKRNFRQDINRARKEMVEIKKGKNYLNDCLRIINDTAKKANIGLLTSNKAEKMLFYLGDKFKIYVSYFDNILQSAAVFLGNEYCTYAMYAGCIFKAFRGSNVYLDWNAILDAKNGNSSCLDFVGARLKPEPGSKLERIQNYKSSFGSEFVQGYLWKIVISKGKFIVYNIMLKLYFLLKNKKMKKDIIDQEFEKQKNEEINSDN